MKTARNLTAILALIAFAMPAAAADSAGETVIVLKDKAGDANGLNDGGEGYIRDIATPRDVAEADLEAVAISPLRNGNDETVGYTVAISTTGGPGIIAATATPLRYSVVMQVTPSCRLSVNYVWTATGGRGDLTASCDNAGVFRTITPLGARIVGNNVVIDVPYSAGPPDMRPGEVVEQTEAFSRAAPLPVPLYSTAIDTGRTNRAPWTLPG